MKELKEPTLTYVDFIEVTNDMLLAEGLENKTGHPIFDAYDCYDNLIGTIAYNIHQGMYVIAFHDGTAINVSEMVQITGFMEVLNEKEGVYS